MNQTIELLEYSAGEALKRCSTYNRRKGGKKKRIGLRCGLIPCVSSFLMDIGRRPRPEFDRSFFISVQYVVLRNLGLLIKTDWSVICPLCC